MSSKFGPPPACYGAASMYARDSAVCRGCVGYEGCSEEAYKTLQAIKDVINVEDLLKRHEKMRKDALVEIKKRDEAKRKDMPPGNVEKPITVKPVERKTEVVKVTFEVSEDENALIAKLPVKVQPHAILLMKRDLVDTIKTRIAEKGRFDDLNAPHFIKETLTLLVRCGFTRSELTHHLTTTMKKSSASSHASQATRILKFFGFAQETEGRLVPLPGSSA